MNHTGGADTNPSFMGTVTFAQNRADEAMNAEKLKTVKKKFVFLLLHFGKIIRIL